MQRERRKNNDILFHFRKDGLPMTKLSQLKIDPEFQNQINPPSFEETHQLEICKPRTSVRKQLSETKQAASPKKAAARSKQHEMEV